jgi:hypothetical protein
MLKISYLIVCFNYYINVLKHLKEKKVEKENNTKKNKFISDLNQSDNN